MNAAKISKMQVYKISIRDFFRALMRSDARREKTPRRVLRYALTGIRVLIKALTRAILLKGRSDRFPESAAPDPSFYLTDSRPRKREWKFPVVPPSETGLAVPPVKREGVEGARARIVEII